jgi:DNA-directed RNA polymerase beta' subunit
MADEAHQILSKISKDDQILLGIEKPENIIIRRLAVAPPPVRPAV